MSALPRWSDADDPLLALPKVSLHDHLDGSLRPETILELADAQGQALPYRDPETLAGWFQGTVPEPKVENWDEKFGVTTRLMQDPESIARVAREFVLDLAADGVVYGETRWAPEKHVGKGLSLSETVEAVTAGLAEGERLAGGTIRVRQLLCGMRTSNLSTEIAKLTIEHYGASVVGFDVAGVEEGFPARDHLEACRLLEAANVPFTFHTGESDGVRSVKETVHDCHALRLGHGVRIVEDVFLDGAPLNVRTAVSAVGERVDDLVLGPLARWVRDRRIPLEVCLTSNSGGGVVDGRANHPLGLLKALGFTLTLSPDNRMMSATCLTREMRRATDEFGFGTEDLLTVTRNAALAAFLPLPERQALIRDVIEPAWRVAVT